MLKTVLLLIGIASSGLWPMLQPASLEAPLSTVIPVDQEQHGFVNSVALTSFFRQLTAIENHSRSRQIRIVQYGDSHTKVDLFTGAVRKNFLRDFGGDAASLVKKTSYRPSSGGSSMSVYQPMGINGARAKRLRDMSESASFLQSLSQSRPDLIVLAYGTNEVTDGDWTVDSYSRMLVGIMTRLRSAAPNAAILMIGPPDRSVMGSGGWTSVKRMSLLLEAQRRAAYLGNAALWSEYEAMGGAGSMNEWVSSGLGRFDHVHFTAAGYSRLARLFYTDLISLYRGEQPEHSPLVQGLDLRAMRGVPPSVTKP